MMAFWNHVSATFLWAVLPFVGSFLLFLIYLGVLIRVGNPLRAEFDRNFRETLKKRYLPLGLSLPHSMRRTQFYIWAVCNPAKANKAIPRQEYVHFDRRVSSETLRLARVAQRISTAGLVLFSISFVVVAACDLLGLKL